MLKNINDVLGLVLMNPYVKVPILTVLRIYFNKHQNITQRRYHHSQIQGRQCLLYVFIKPLTDMTK